MSQSARRQAIFDRDGGLCWLCEEPVDPDDWQIDHLIPREIFRQFPADQWVDQDDPTNLATSHGRCNRRRPRWLYGAKTERNRRVERDVERAIEAQARHETDMWFPAFIAGFVADPIGSVENAPRSVRSIVRTLVEE